MPRPMLLMALTSVLFTTAAQAADPSEPARESVLDDTRIICRKTLETGSLVRKKKQCFTEAEWDRIAQQTRIGNQKVADQLSGACAVQGGVC